MDQANKQAATGIPGALPTFAARLTGYWPFTAKASERQMEGGTNDRRGNALHTLEDAQAGRAPFVSVSGDDAIFPYGQALRIDAFPGVLFRVVDTGGHFRGAGKVYRVAGREPLDVCVASSATKVPPLATVQIIPGDTLDKPGRVVASGKFRGQTVTGLDVLGGRVA
jgi:hypothetical protein